MILAHFYTTLTIICHPLHAWVEFLYIFYPRIIHLPLARIPALYITLVHELEATIFDRCWHYNYYRERRHCISQPFNYYVSGNNFLYQLGGFGLPFWAMGGTILIIVCPCLLFLKTSGEYMFYLCNNLLSHIFVLVSHIIITDIILYYYSISTYGTRLETSNYTGT